MSRLLLALLGLAACQSAAAQTASPPATLRATGLYVDGSSTVVRREHLAFSPQYPLWSDGAEKRRWLSLPAGTSIDASDPDDWRFPVGTRVWKEFAFAGRRVETRYMEALADGTWRYATYVWAGDEATLAPDAGQILPVGPAGRYAVPSTADCHVCHDGRPTPVLGFSALQLSADRDPRALHAASQPGDVDLPTLVERGLVRGLPATLGQPRIAASSPTERAARGYLHGNCGGCHNDRGPLAPLGLVLAYSLRSDARPAVGQTSRFRLPAHPEATHHIVAGRPDLSVLPLRMRSRDPLAQMAPLGTFVVDEEAVQLVETWIREVPDLESAQPAAKEIRP